MALGTGHHVDLKKPWAAICKAADIKKLRLHDLRHSYASLAVAGNASLPLIGKLLGHTQVATARRYAHLDIDPLREVTERVGAIIESAGKAGAEVVKLRRTWRPGCQSGLRARSISAARRFYRFRRA
jgi:hypothetical protein